MRIHPVLLGVVAGVMISACQPRAPQFAASDEVAVRAVFDSVASQIAAGQWVAWAAQFAEDAVLQPPNAPSVNGRAAILTWGQAFPQVESSTFSDVKVWGEGNVASGTSAYALKLKDLPLDTGKQLVVFRRTPSGKWEVRSVAFSSDLPLPTAAPAGTPSRE